MVTGSRLRRGTYNSISPLQVITAESQREVGLINAADILQSSTASSGQQIDLTFNGFVTDNGPGTSTVSLRGLGADRTLVLLNGRRLAPSGVEGAPSAPNLNQVPASLVQQYDLLLDGASSIYGSDAIGGVANVILRKDFDGVEFSLSQESPGQPGGDDTNLSLAWGENYDRGFFGVGIEYNKSVAVSVGDRAWTAGCDMHREVDENGNINSTDLFLSRVYGMTPTPCKTSSLAGRVIVSPRAAGSIYYTPGRSNGGWPGFSESSLYGRFGVDGNGDGQTDVDFQDYDLDNVDQAANIFPNFERFSAMTYGEYTFEGEMNISLFFETLYGRTDVSGRGSTAQLFPVVPANNPFNICNPNGVRGVDCGLAYDALLSNPNVQRTAAAAGISNAVLRRQRVGALGPTSTRIVAAVEGDRSGFSVTNETIRVVTGIRADLPQFNKGSFSGWYFSADFVYNHAKGVSSRLGIREDLLDLSLATTIEDPNNPGQYICGVDNNGDGIPDGTDGCVPIDLFAGSLYQNVTGDFATQAERDYLFDSRDFDTVYEQYTLSGFLGGSVYSLPAGDISLGVGIELREDEINSIPDDVARDGLFFGFFSDGGAVGGKYTREAYVEMAIPLLGDLPLVSELELNLSARYTEDEYYGSAWTHATKVGYRPFDSLLLRFTRGTSYRAPNLRENFLQGQSGFLNLFDPCVVPESAIDAITGYNPGADMRAPEVLANCLANGIDPLTLFNGISSYSVEISTGGSLDLNEETSVSTTWGFAFQQPFTNAFDLSVGATYYDYNISNVIIEPSAQFIINDCYNKVAMDSVFCGRIARGADGLLDLVSSGFLNRANETVRGVDINIDIEKTLTLGGRVFEFSFNAILNRSLEQSTTDLNQDGVAVFEDDVGFFGFPKWRGRYGFRLDYGKHRATWEINYLGKQGHDPEDIDPLSDIFGSSSTCVGPSLGGVRCRDVAEVGSYTLHHTSVSYRGDLWTIALGLRNVFNKAPPRVDSSEASTINGTLIGRGYDINGRSLFFNIAYRL